MTPLAQEELKVCPFCGKAPEIVNGSYGYQSIQCVNKSCKMQPRTAFQQPAVLSHIAWQMRPALGKVINHPTYYAPSLNPGFDEAQPPSPENNLDHENAAELICEALNTRPAPAKSLKSAEDEKVSMCIVSKEEIDKRPYIFGIPAICAIEDGMCYVWPHPQYQKPPETLFMGEKNGKR